MRRFVLGIALVLGVLALAACGQAAPTPAPEAEIPAEAPTAAPQRLTFPAEPPLEARVQGDLAAGEIRQFVFPAQEGETLTVQVTTDPADGAILSIWGADGTVLLSDHATAAQWSGEVPGTQDYTVAVIGGPEAVSFTLTVQRAPAQAEPSATPLTLDAQGQAQVQGDLAAGEIRHFTVSAQAGQQLAVQVTTNPADGAILSVWGADGTVLLSDHATAAQWSGEVPGTQDYTIAVIGGPEAVSFTLTVQVTGP